MVARIEAGSDDPDFNDATNSMANKPGFNPLYQGVRRLGLPVPSPGNLRTVSICSRSRRCQVNERRAMDVPQDGEEKERANQQFDPPCLDNEGRHLFVCRPASGIAD